MTPFWKPFLVLLGLSTFSLSGKAHAVTNFYHAANCQESNGQYLSLSRDLGWYNETLGMKYVTCSIPTDGNLGKDATDVTNINLRVRSNGSNWNIRLCYQDPDSFAKTCGAAYTGNPGAGVDDWLASGVELTLYSGATAWDNVVIVVGIPATHATYGDAALKAIKLVW
jgi:hypothetical protein